MAKARPIEDVECDGAALAGASAVLRTRFHEILEFHADAVAQDGVDGIHDMRVASRRFRSALRDFAPLFENKSLKPLKSNAKAVADALGQVRDQDVAIDALASLREKAPNEAITAGIDRLIETRRARRSQAHTQLIKHLSADRLGSLRGCLDESLDFRSLEKGEPAIFRSFAADAIERAHNKFLERAGSIYHPFDDKALHKLRLSAKRLRYALELFDNCWEGELRPFGKYVSRLQSSLGEVHDSSEWIVYLGQIGANYDIERQTAAWLISEFVSLRTAEYLKVLELWNEWLASELSGRLRAIIAE